MAKLPKVLSDLLAGGHNVWVGTVDADGMPNVSIKGSGALLDDEHLYFADMFSRKTRENLALNGRVAVGIHDPEMLMSPSRPLWASMNFSELTNIPPEPQHGS